MPLYRDRGSDMPATQFNMKWVEQAGLVKFDFLGPEDADRHPERGRPDQWRWPPAACRRRWRRFTSRLRARNQINAIPLDDKASYDPVRPAPATVAVFPGGKPA